MLSRNGYSGHFLLAAVILVGLSTTTSAAQTVIKMKLAMYDDVQPIVIPVELFSLLF